MDKMDETEYLLSSEKNKEVLMRSIKQAKSAMPSQEPLTDVEYVIKLLQTMNINELDSITMECDYLIENIKNSFSD